MEHVAFIMNAESNTRVVCRINLSKKKNNISFIQQFLHCYFKHLKEHHNAYLFWFKIFILRIQPTSENRSSVCTFLLLVLCNWAKCYFTSSIFYSTVFDWRGSSLNWTVRICFKHLIMFFDSPYYTVLCTSLIEHRFLVYLLQLLRWYALLDWTFERWPK